MKTKKHQSRKVTIAKQPQWLSQGVNSVICGAVAVYNAKLWRGDEVSPKNIRKLCADVGVSQKLKGVCGSTLDRYIRQKRHFGVKGIVKPKWSQTLKHLKSGGGVIIRFRWFREGKSSGHYSFLCIDSSGKIVVANPHLIVGAKSRDRWRYATPKDIEDFSKNITVGRRVYPMIWPIERL